MLPLEPYLLMWLKFFVVFTCIFFWINLGYKIVMRNHRIKRRPYHQ